MVPSSPTGARLLAERYRLERPLARGAMGELWVARDESLDRAVAVKLVSTSLGDSALVRTRFQREARAAARLRSPHVVPVFDHGEDGGLGFIVMELLEGEGLDKRLKRIGPCSLAGAVWLIEQVARGLTVAHDAGVIHRDLKPANLFLARSADEEIVKILDFGIAKLAGFDGATTMTGELVGSPFYMSPEQALGTVELDHRSDLWAVGVIVYYALTGRIAFRAPSLALALDRIRSAPVPPPSSLVAHLSPAVDAFFARALARPVEERFQSAREMAQAFADAANVAPIPLEPDAHTPHGSQHLPSAPSSPLSWSDPAWSDPARSDPAWSDPNSWDDESALATLASDAGATQVIPPEAVSEGGRTHRGVSRPIGEAPSFIPGSFTPRVRPNRGKVVAATVGATASIVLVLGFAAHRLTVADRPSPAPAPATRATPSSASSPAEPAPRSSVRRPAETADAPTTETAEPVRSETHENAGEGSSERAERRAATSAGHEPPAKSREPPSKSRAPRPADKRPTGSEGSPKRLELGY